MMQHIRDFDWEATNQMAEDKDFRDEATISNHVIQRMVGGTHRDPLLSSEDEDSESNIIDWDVIHNTKKIFVPGLRPQPIYPKLSVLTAIQHYQLLKIICANHPHILIQQSFFYKPLPDDHNTYYEILKPIYENEQREFIEWAKSLWKDEHYIRALYPKRRTETVYQAELMMRQHRLKGFPTCFDKAGDIQLEHAAAHQYDIELIKTYFGVNISELPLVKLPQHILEEMFVTKDRSHPNPCHKHTYQFELPHKNSVSVLPITELHQELAQYAAENGTRFIASENALRCLMELNRHWTIPISVSQQITSDGKICNVLVLDSEFSIQKELAMTRTYKAMKHMLETALIPIEEVVTMVEKRKKKHIKSGSKKKCQSTSMGLAKKVLHLCNDENQSDHIIGEDKSDKASGDIDTEASKDITEDDICDCSFTRYELPPMRSFKKWRLKNTVTAENFDFIVHCAHKATNNSKEVVLEPIPEYQLEMGGSELSPDRIRALVLSLIFRDNVDIVNVRLDGCNGEIVTIDSVSKDEFIDTHIEQRHQVLNIMHSTLSKLQGLPTGHYLLQHAPNDGASAFLHVARPDGDSVKLDFISKLVDSDEISFTKIPPTIAPVLMPFHKFHKILPCAFSPYEGKKVSSQLNEEKKVPPEPKPQPKAVKNRKGKLRKIKNKSHAIKPQQHV